MSTDNQTAKQNLVDKDTTTEGQGVAPGTEASLVFNDCKVSTSATAGANGDVPAQVVGYVEVVIGGVNRKVAFYAD